MISGLVLKYLKKAGFVMAECYTTTLLAQAKLSDKTWGRSDQLKVVIFRMTYAIFLIFSYNFFDNAN